MEQDDDDYKMNIKNNLKYINWTFMRNGGETWYHCLDNENGIQIWSIGPLS